MLFGEQRERLNAEYDVKVGQSWEDIMSDMISVKVEADGYCRVYRFPVLDLKAIYESIAREVLAKAEGNRGTGGAGA